MSRITHPPRDALELTRVLHALSDPVRLEVVRSLAENGEQTCAALDGDRPKSTMSHHFKVLRAAGIVETRGERTSHLNRLRAEDLEARFPGLLQAVLNG
ncbi:MAG: helix-turn-helix transcriptional regulator [Caulobacterales bacterium]|nr:helix-turn-helix transcriptional regulator [Caulobacterales bacterium]